MAASIWLGSGSMSELGLRGQFGPGLGQFGDPNWEVSGNDPVGMEQSQMASLVDGVRRRREVEDEMDKALSTSNGNGNGSNDGDSKRLKTSGGSDKNHNSKAEAQPSSSKFVEQKAHPSEPSKDYIHVRARRGQAAGSHSLAERARREKISERMKILQDLVPGCNKVIGKALVLDEIINYIQLLERQVEFLSMKLEAVNSGMNPGVEVFPPEEYGQQAFDATGVVFAPQGTTVAANHPSGCMSRYVAVLKEERNI